MGSGSLLFTKNNFMTTAKVDNQRSPVLVRSGSTAALVIMLLLLIWTAGSAGFSSFLSGYALAANQLDAANSAVRLSPNNPDAHLTSAALLETINGLPSAIPEYEKAASLRPGDYVLWLALARANEMNGDASRAIAAGRQAAKLAPYYAEPHWQLGNILLRAGERDEGFRELSIAAESDATLMPGIIDLAWHLSNGDAKAVEQIIQPHSAKGYRALARYFRQRGDVDEAVAMFKSAGSEAQSDIQAYVGELIANKKYAQAYALWAVSHNTQPPGTITNAGFEEESDLAEPGFGWRTADPPQAWRFSLDPTNPSEGRLSLRAEFTGNSDPASPAISQIVLVQPLTHYQLRFAARTENLVSAGLPIIIVIDGDSKSGLAKSEQFPRTTAGWREYAVDFSTGPATTAIQIALQREGCIAPCPIFGRIWLDAFSLRKL